MKTILKYTFIFCAAIALFSFSSCSGDSNFGEGEEDSNTAFRINGDSFETKNAYLVFSTVPQFNSETMMDEDKVRNRFSLLFMNGIATVNEGNLLFSTTTNHSSYHQMNSLDDSKTIVDAIEDVVIENTVYTQRTTNTRISINGIETEYTENGSNFGNPVFAGINYQLTNEDTATFTINTITIDYENMNGFIDCSYSISPSLEGPITGMYSGPFQILIQ